MHRDICQSIQDCYYIGAVSQWSTSWDGTERSCFVRTGVTLEKKSGKSNQRVGVILKCKERLVASVDVRQREGDKPVGQVDLLSP